MARISVTLRQFQDATLQPGKERVISGKESPFCSLPPTCTGCHPSGHPFCARPPFGDQSAEHHFALIQSEVRPFIKNLAVQYQDSPAELHSGAAAQTRENSSRLLEECLTSTPLLAG